jgi:DNA-binding transcriptional LysR family regulator
MDHSAVQPLQGFEHWPIVLHQQSVRDVRFVVRVDADQVRVERRVVDFRERDAVWHHRLAGFTASRPDVDVRISAGYGVLNLDRDGVDVAVRYQTQQGAGSAGLRLFGEVVTPVCAPRLRRDPARPLKRPEDLRHHCLLHLDSGPGTHLLEWPPWLRAMKLDGLKPANVLHFSMYDQLIQAAASGQGVALGRLPLVNELIAQRRLVAPFSDSVASPRSYFLFQSNASRSKPEVREFLNWMITLAATEPVLG